MSDKPRHRLHPVPHGGMPNWVLVLFGACAIVVVQVARSLV
jgi:hypothetical protein